MTFRLHVETDGAAFSEEDGTVTADSARLELARMLRLTAMRLEHGCSVDADGRALVDINGNTCGRFALDLAPPLADLELPELLEVLGFDVEHDGPEEIHEKWNGQRFTRRRYAVRITRTDDTGHVRRTLPIEWTCGEAHDGPTPAELVYSVVLDAQYLEDGAAEVDNLTLREALDMAEAIRRNAAELEALVDTDEERDAIGDAAGRY